MAFSASDAAFEGFRVARREPMAILIWALAYIVFTVVCFVLAGGSFLALMALAGDLEQVAEPTLQDLQPLWGAYLGIIWILPLALAFSAMLYAAATRAVLWPEQRRFGYLRLGMDELRVFVVTVVLSIMIGVATIAIFVLAAVIAAAASEAAGDAAGLISFVIFVAAAAAVIWLMLRFSLAAPMTMDQGRFAIFDSWGATKGRGLALFGMTVIVLIMTFVVSILLSIILLPIMFFAGGMTDINALQSLDAATVMGQMGPAMILYVIYNGFVSALTVALIYTPYAAAYRDIRGSADPVVVEPTPSL